MERIYCFFLAQLDNFVHDTFSKETVVLGKGRECFFGVSDIRAVSEHSKDNKDTAGNIL